MIEYNGWANYPTWCVHLWLSNDEHSYDRARGIALLSSAEAETDYREWIGSVVPTGTLASDLLGWTLAHVNWSEIIEAFREEP